MTTKNMFWVYSMDMGSSTKDMFGPLYTLKYEENVNISNASANPDERT